jgi:hypothetical protein
MAINAASRLPAAASPGRPRRALGAIACIAVVVGVVLLTPSSRRQSAPVPGATATPFAVSGVVVTEGGPPPPPGQSDVRPDSHQSLTISGTTDHGAHMTRFTTTDARGRFALRLAPGTYTVTARAFGGSIPADGQPHARVVIQPGHSLHVRITAHVN